MPSEAKLIAKVLGLPRIYRRAKGDLWRSVGKVARLLGEEGDYFRQAMAVFVRESRRKEATPTKSSHIARDNLDRLEENPL
jgi:hypothetical protein